MVEYQRPEFYVEEFVANEYVAACAWEVGTELTIQCGDGSAKVVIQSESGGNYNLEGGGTMWLNTGTNKDEVKYGTQVSMAFPHEQTYGSYSISAGEYHTTMDPNYESSGVNPCQCNFILANGSTANANNHHHITNIINHSRS